MIHVISLGAGVQSTTMALMAAHGELMPMPDCAVFADTGWEPQTVYRHLDWLIPRLPFPVFRLRRDGDDLGQHAIRIAHEGITRTASPPWFTKDPQGMLPQHCSKEFKARVVSKKVREMLGIAPGERGPRAVVAAQWLGISLDEAGRMKPGEHRYIEHRYPLIEQRIKRQDCLAWMQQHGYPRPPKSACIFCPWHDADQYRRLEPEDWQRLVAFDAAIRPGYLGMEGTAYVHRDRVPVDQVDLSTAEDRGQGNLFMNECEGMCGV